MVDFLQKGMDSLLEAMPEENEDEEISEATIDNVYPQSFSNTEPDDEAQEQAADKPPTNQFDSLCEGLVTALHMIRLTVEELQTLKDDLLKHTLPPELLARLVICTSKVFRSVSDCQVPAGELVRLVNLYSGSWDEKSSALSKLHDSYAAKKIQLDIALRKLSLTNGKMQRLEKQKRLMNWEKLFLRTLVCKELGDKYEEATAPLRKSSVEDVESLRQLVFEMNDLPAARELVRKNREKRLSVQQTREDFSEENVNLQLADDDVIPTKADQASMRATSSERGSVRSGSNVTNKAGEVNVLTLEGDNLTMQDSQSGLGSVVGKSVADDQLEEIDILSISHAESIRSMRSQHRGGTTSQKQVLVRTEMHDAQVSTSDNEFDVYLYARIFAPEGLRSSLPVRCIVTLGDQRISTIPLYSGFEDLPVPSQTEPAVNNQLSVKRGRRGLIGSRNSSGNLVASSSSDETGSKSGKEQPVVASNGPNRQRYDDCVFLLNDEVMNNINGSSGQAFADHFTFTLYSVLDNQQIGVATVGMDDLINTDLMSLFLPPPDGVTDDVCRIHSSASTGTLSADDSSSDVTNAAVKYSFDKCPVAIHSLRNQLDGVRPMSFPVFPPPSGNNNNISQLANSLKLPISLCWVKRVRPQTFDRMTQSESINDIVLDVTGVDVASFSKDVSRPETYERSVSAMSEPLFENDEFIPRAEYMKVLRNHEEEVQIMKAEYEARLQDLTEALQLMHESQADEFRMRATRPKSPAARAPLRKSYPSGRAFTALDPIAEPLVARERPTRTVPARNVDTPDTLTTNWGEEIPRNFFDRLRHFEERVRQRREALCSQSREQTSDAIEKRLADQRKLSRQSQLDTSDLLAQDVSLPAVFMPTKTRDLNIYNPRAHQYFHATGSGKLRLTQPPSMVQLPPIPQTNVSVVNLFDICRNFRRGENGSGESADWLIRQYINQQTKTTDDGATVPIPTAAVANENDSPKADGCREPELLSMS